MAFSASRSESERLRYCMPLPEWWISWASSVSGALAVRHRDLQGVDREVAGGGTLEVCEPRMIRL